jgi:hypothetical protein
VHGALAAAGLPHAIGGAVALAHYGVPRPTTDLDVNAFVGPERWPEVSAALAPLGVDVKVDPESVERDGEARLAWNPVPLHLFLSTDELHEVMRRGVRTAWFGGTIVPFVTPEHLVVRKALLDRPKDWLDIEQILLATRPLDLTEILSRLEQLVGPSDPRLRRIRLYRYRH